MSAFAQDMKDKYGVTVLMSHEKDPLGTFGAIKQAEDMLRSSDSQSSFFVCNADIICDYPFQEMIDYMQEHPSAEGVIALTKVLEPQKYGVVLFNEEGRVTQFVEKPAVWVGDQINAGIYLLK